jgi:hypothetical protein
MLLVQKFLETHSLGDLQKEHGVYVSFNKNGEYASFNYDMIETKDDDLLAQECRGLILCHISGKPYAPIIINGKKSYTHIIMGETKILCFGIKRFFNYGQASASNINFNAPNLKIYEKLDGSLIQVWNNPFNKLWNISTRSCPDADILMDNGIFTFRMLFEKALYDHVGIDFNQLTSYLDSNFTYCFELCSLLNRIVVNYNNNRIVLLAARNLVSLQEVDINNLNLPLLVPKVQEYTYTSIQELIDWVSTFNPSEYEGVVVRDSNFNRIKVKSAAYVAASKIRESLAASPRNCLKLILLGKEDDAMSFLPEDIIKNLLSIKEKYRKWLSEEEFSYSKILSESDFILPKDKKTFAITLNKYPDVFKPAHFSIFDGRAGSIKDFIENQKKDGTWSNNFLDKILCYIKNISY